MPSEPVPPADNLPEYGNPPVVETVLGVEFPALDRWSIVHFGLLWHQLRKDYPEFSVHPPLLPESARSASPFPLVFGPEPPVRCWFANKEAGRLIQVQRDRFVLNWRREGVQPYPRYAKYVRPAFEQSWGRFVSFLTENAIPLPQASVCEVTYLNHIGQGEEWSTLADLPNVVRGWSPPAGPFLPLPEIADFDLRYPISDTDHLAVQLRRAIRATDKVDILQLTLTARCRPRSTDLDELLRCFDLGRYWIVNGFTELTTERMHSVWKRTR
jgi:uncharacterized protein (TIGR04255 family)